MDRVTVGGKNGKINFHNFIMIVIPSKFTIDFSEIEKVPRYAEKLRTTSTCNL